MRAKYILGAAVAGLLVTTTAARAALVYDTITVYDGAGSVIGSVVATPAEVAANPNGVFYVSGVAVDQSQFGNYGIVLAGVTPVDIFGIGTPGPDGFDLAFGPGGQAAGYPVQNPVADTGLPISMTMYLAPALQSAGDTAYFTATGNLTVPEPGTWVMMLLGVAAIGIATRRRTAGAAVAA